jgi:hypothetical protein
MSSLTTTTINTRDAVTNLTVSTGNTSGPAIVVGSSTDVWIRANTSSNSLIANSSGVRFPLTVTVNGAVTISNTLSTGNTTITGLLSTGNTTITGTGSVSTNTFNLGSSSKTANGYTYLFNGVIMQWGQVLANTVSGNVTFSVSFPNAILQSVCTGNNTTSGEVSIEAQSVSGLQLRCEDTTNPANKLVRYIAIGY